ncbi:hypothetical protein [Halalkalibacter alkalisediminis]|uniref:Uncharacterized protein n=1 Tax=Halalkalibacter alkalisediminis TaxID=935616 RepID=A0ABV6NJ73_9BACI|nr:hypothetical protein [Halalkalibacter alkalisediminis]
MLRRKLLCFGIVLSIFTLLTSNVSAAEREVVDLDDLEGVINLEELSEEDPELAEKLREQVE